MTTPFDYLEARKRVEEALGWTVVRGNQITLSADTLRAILNPPRPTVEDVAELAVEIADLRFDRDPGIDMSEAEPGKWAIYGFAATKIAERVLALFTTPEGIET